MTPRKKNTTTRYPHSVLGGLAALLVGVAAANCAASMPKELRDARDAYGGAAAGPAAQFNPAQLHTAQQALKLAEKTFDEEGASERTRDRAYVAMRKAQLADTQARVAELNGKLQAAEKQSEQEQVAELERTQDALQRSEQERGEAEAKATATAAELAKLATVKQEARGMVITLSGSVLFASGKAELLPGAQRRLTEVARALNDKNGEALIVVEGHTDAKGREDYNLELSARRAQAVSTYLVSQGIAENRIRAEGLGFSRPVADNKTAEGRANNRRVEIVVQPATSGPGANRAGS